MVIPYSKAFQEHLLTFLPALSKEAPLNAIIEVLLRGESFAIRAPPRIASSGATLASYISTQSPRHASTAALYLALLPIALLPPPVRIIPDQANVADIAAKRRARALKPQRALGYAALGLTPAAPRWAVLHAQAEADVEAGEAAARAAAVAAARGDASDDEASDAGAEDAEPKKVSFAVAKGDLQGKAMAAAAKAAAATPHTVSFALVLTTDYETTVRAMRALHALADTLDEAAAADDEARAKRPLIAAPVEVPATAPAKRAASEVAAKAPPAKRGPKGKVAAAAAAAAAAMGDVDDIKAGAPEPKPAPAAVYTVAPPPCRLEIVHVAASSKSGKSAAAQVSEALRADKDPVQMYLPAAADPNDHALARRRERALAAPTRARRVVLVGTPGSVAALAATDTGRDALARVVATAVVSADDIVRWGATLDKLAAAVRAPARRAELGIPPAVTTATFSVLSKPVRRALTIFGAGADARGPVVVDAAGAASSAEAAARSTARVPLSVAEVPVTARYGAMLTLLRSAVSVRRTRAVVVCGTSATAAWYADATHKLEALTVGTRRPTDYLSADAPDVDGARDADIVALHGRLLDAGVAAAAEEWRDVESGVLFAPVHDLLTPVAGADVSDWFRDVSTVIFADPIPPAAVAQVCLEVAAVAAPGGAAPKQVAAPPRKRGGTAAAPAAPAAGSRQLVWLSTPTDASAVKEVAAAGIGCSVEPLDPVVSSRLATRARALAPEVEKLMNEDYAACKGGRDACRALLQRHVELSPTGSYSWSSCRPRLADFATSFGLSACPAVRSWLVDTSSPVEGAVMANVIAFNPRINRPIGGGPLVPKASKKRAVDSSDDDENEPGVVVKAN